MPCFKPKKIHIRNFETVQDTVLELPDKGLVLVLGVNQSGGGKLESIGAGKTLLGEALCRTVLGVTGKYTGLGSYATRQRGKKGLYVKVEGMLDAQPATFELGYRTSELSKTGEGFRFTVGDSGPVERSAITATRKEAALLLGVTEELAQWTVFIDGDKLKFNTVPQKGKVSLLMQALNQPTWETYERSAKDTLDALKKNRDTNQVKHATAALSRSRSMADLDEAERKLSQAEQDYKDDVDEMDEKVERIRSQKDTFIDERSVLESSRKTISARLKELEEDDAQAHKKLTVKLNQASTRVSELTIELEQARGDAKVTREKLSLAREVYNTVAGEPDTCPRCGKVWDKKHAESELVAAKKSLDAAKDAHEKNEDKVQRSKDAVDKGVADKQSVEEDMDSHGAGIETAKISRQLDRITRDLEENAASIASAELGIEREKKGPSRTELDRAQTRVEERQRHLTGAEKDVKDFSSQLSEADELVKLGAYAVETFGPNGIPNMILEESIAPLNSISRRLSALMTGGTTSLTYSTQRLLAKGDEVAELVVSVDNVYGAGELVGSSKGEGGISNLIIAETLAEVGATHQRIGFRWYDEVVNPQDPLVRASIFRYLHDLARDRDLLIFVVDHYPDASRFADYTLIATKNQDGITSYSWS